MPSTTPLTPVVSTPGSSRVHLSKGQAISLEEQGGTLTVVRLGLGWQAAPHRRLFGKRNREIDLDMAAVLFADKVPVDIVFFQHLVSDDGSVQQTAGRRDEESILIDLQRVSAHIDQIVFTATSFTGQTFQEVQNVFCRLVDEANSQELARYTLSGGGRHNMQIMAKVHRSGASWRMTAIGAPGNGRTFQDVMPAILPHL
ncbi:tellurium resistance TerZ family protein [Streptomyces sp. ISL-98]|uniref:TerD family protein n=1 Tax=Streptomyces sp. ISL-98 TaxID=2819192 RepID=UPI001BE6343D|nr:TerD family protein [Streptomyces sp. ISL-98]MBT2505865.1 tellurium resistance TerZ family protein [Streptomyces sp. ISL-98]